jgi:hypothetical protein
LIINWIDEAPIITFRKLIASVGLMVLVTLGALFLGLLACFWLTPIGVPALKRLAGGKAPPDLRFGYGVDETYQLLDRYGPAGIAHWRRLLLLDMIFPAVYALLFSSLAHEWAGFVEAGPIWRFAAIAAPLASCASDYAENLALLRALDNLPARSPGIVTWASRFTRGKFVFLLAIPAIPFLQWGFSVASGTR